MSPLAKKYTSTPEEVEAIFLGEEDDLHAIAKWCGGEVAESLEIGDVLRVPTLKGALELRRREWLVKDLATGGYYGMEEETFAEHFGARPEEPKELVRRPTGFPASYPTTDPPVRIIHE